MLYSFCIIRIKTDKGSSNRLQKKIDVIHHSFIIVKKKKRREVAVEHWQMRSNQWLLGEEEGDLVTDM